MNKVLIVDLTVHSISAAGKGGGSVRHRAPCPTSGQRRRCRRWGVLACLFWGGGVTISQCNGQDDVAGQLGLTNAAC